MRQRYHIIIPVVVLPGRHRHRLVGFPVPRRERQARIVQHQVRARLPRDGHRHRIRGLRRQAHPVGAAATFAHRHGLRVKPQRRRVLVVISDAHQQDAAEKASHAGDLQITAYTQKRYVDCVVVFQERQPYRLRFIPVGRRERETGRLGSDHSVDTAKTECRGGRGPARQLHRDADDLPFVHLQDPRHHPNLRQGNLRE